ncbi:plasmid mobilization protein, partial [Prevotella bivia]
LNTYHSVATAQQLLGKLETYSQILIRLQQQAVQLTKSFGSREE